MGWRPPLPPVTIAEKADSSLLCAFSSLSLVNALQARPPGLKVPALGRSLDIQSQAILEMGFYWPLGTTVRFSFHLWTITEKHPR